MSKTDRRSQKQKAIAAVNDAKAFIVVAWDGKKLPAYFFDVSMCKNESDLRHYVMQSLAEEVEVAHRMAIEALDRKDDIAEAAKLGKQLEDEKLITNKILTFEKPKIILPGMA